LDNCARYIDIFEKGFDDFYGIIGAARVANAIGIDPWCYRFQESFDNTAFVFYDHIETKLGVGPRFLYFF
jgi:hypothetical protein